MKETISDRRAEEGLGRGQSPSQSTDQNPAREENADGASVGVAMPFDQMADAQGKEVTARVGRMDKGWKALWVEYRVLLLKRITPRHRHRRHAEESMVNSSENDDARHDSWCIESDVHSRSTPAVDPSFDTASVTNRPMSGVSSVRDDGCRHRNRARLVGLPTPPPVRLDGAWSKGFLV